MERRAYAHGDLRPDNLPTDQLRIHDFDSAIPVGSPLPVATEAFARLLSKDDGRGGGTAWLARTLRISPSALIHSIEDGIISVCWHGGYATVAGLEQVFGDMMDGTEWYLFPADADEWVAQHQDEYAT